MRVYIAPVGIVVYVQDTSKWADAFKIWKQNILKTNIPGIKDLNIDWISIPGFARTFSFVNSIEKDNKVEKFVKAFKQKQQDSNNTIARRPQLSEKFQPNCENIRSEIANKLGINAEIVC